MAENIMDDPVRPTPVVPPSLACYESGWTESTLAFLADSTLTFPEVFAKRCRERPDSVAFDEVLWAPPNEPEARPRTYGYLEEQARRACACLESVGVTGGERVLLCVQSPGAFFAFFLGAQALGAIPVPLPSAADAGMAVTLRDRIAAVGNDCKPRAIVADDQRGLDIVGAGLAAGVARIDASQLKLEAAPVRTASMFSLSRPFEEVAFIQYTSGSTGSPKGVVITQYNLVANLRASAEAGRFSEADRSVFWLPLYHDMGLIGGLLFGIYLGIPTYVMPPKSFISRPDSWLRAISRWKGTFTVGPNFAYNLLSGRLPSSALAGIDLSSWRLAFNGAEPIDRATVEAFIRRFEPYGFRGTSFFPVYGMAETTLSTAFPVPGAPVGYDTVDREELSRSTRAIPVAHDAPGAVTFVSVGTAMPGHRLVIRSPDGSEELPERHVGEVVASGPSVSQHYFVDGELPTPRVELRTGDLGYIADGNLYIVDRMKDLIIIAGRNIVPSDVERVAGRVEGVRYGAVVAFGRRGSDGTEELCVVAGIEREAKPSIEALRAQLAWCIQQNFSVTPRDVVLVDPRSIPKTSSGKIQRATCRQLYEAGGFNETVKATG